MFYRYKYTPPHTYMTMETPDPSFSQLSPPHGRRRCAARRRCSSRLPEKGSPSASLSFSLSHFFILGLSRSWIWPQPPAIEGGVRRSLLSQTAAPCPRARPLAKPKLKPEGRELHDCRRHRTIVAGHRPGRASSCQGPPMVVGTGHPRPYGG